MDTRILPATGRAPVLEKCEADLLTPVLVSQNTFGTVYPCVGVELRDSASTKVGPGKGSLRVFQGDSARSPVSRLKAQDISGV